MKRIIIIFSLIGFLSFNSNAQFFVKIKPSTPIIKYKKVKHSKHYIWIDGEWIYRNGRYEYVEGYWCAPRRGYRYVPGYWHKNNNGHSWNAGIWIKL